MIRVEQRHWQWWSHFGICERCFIARTVYRCSKLDIIACHRCKRILTGSEV